MDYFAGMSGDDAIHRSPSTSLLEYDEFSSFGDSMFPQGWVTQPNTQEMYEQSPMLYDPPRLNLNTSMPNIQHTGMDFQNSGAIGDRFYDMQQPPAHGRNMSLTSPSIVLGNQPLADAIPPGQYGDRDFIRGGPDRIYLQSADEIAHSVLDIDLINRVSQGHSVLRSRVSGQNMDGIVALRVGLAVLCEASGKVPPTDILLLNFLQQQVSRDRDGYAPQVSDHGIDRPLLLDHLLMIVHRYGLRNNEHYNVGVIRPSSAQPPQFGASATYTISFEGPKTEGSKTIWLYEEAGKWYPLAPKNFSATTKSYADAVKMPPTARAQRPVTPASSNAGLLVPGISPSTRHTPSEAGSDMTGATSLSCRSCGKKFELQTELNHHHRNHKHRNLVCSQPGCGRTFLYHKDLKRHERTHTDKESRMDFICPVASCGKAYTRQDNLRRHQRQDHPSFVPSPSSIASSRGRHGSRHGY